MAVDPVRSRSPWLGLAGVYAAALSLSTLAGIPSTLGISPSSYPGNAVRMPLAAMLIAVGLGAVALALFRHRNIGRFLFLVLAPWGSIALASAFPGDLWKEDIPYTSLAIFAYVPLAFLLARGGALRAAGARNGSWVSRGGALVLACAAAMFLARLIVKTTEPSGWGMNEYVQRLVLCDVPLWNYVIGAIAVSIPSRFSTTAEDRREVAPGAAAAGNPGGAGD